MGFTDPFSPKQGGGRKVENLGQNGRPKQSTFAMFK